MKIIVTGAGAWGTALSVAAAQDAAHSVTLFARDAQQAAAMAAERSNARYLPQVPLPAALRVCAGDAQVARSAVQNADLCIIATPMAALASSLQALSGVCTPIVWLCKGFDEKGLLGHEIHAQAATEFVANENHQSGGMSSGAGIGAGIGVGASVGVLSGPSFAQEVALGQPTALVAASSSPAVRSALVAAFHSERLRVYENDDIVGVEVGGAVKNVLAIATGLCDGLQLGLNARAALITRGLAEMTRLGVALGAKAETFMGLSGLGDLVLTATGDLSRNRKVGLMLAQGQTLAQATASLGHVAEGARCAAAVWQRAQSLGVDMPITQCVVALLAGRIDAQQAVALLMGREPAKEV
jgi:glycerol-3-phosphate dehydrogenase (NAD(P)+)